MRQVAAVRGMPLWPGVAGYVSTPDCRLVDTRRDPTLRTRPFLIVASVAGRTEVYQAVDCSNPAHARIQAGRALVLEVDSSSAARLGFNAYTGHGAGKAPARVLSVCRGRPH